MESVESSGDSEWLQKNKDFILCIIYIVENIVDVKQWRPLYLINIYRLLQNLSYSTDMKRRTISAIYLNFPFNNERVSFPIVL